MTPDQTDAFADAVRTMDGVLRTLLVKTLRDTTPKKSNKKDSE
jgi:hypothetical protein